MRSPDWTSLALLARSRWAHILVGAVVIAATVYKIVQFERSPRFDPHDETCLFWTESAFHYRYAKMVADGKGIPAFDRDVQFPEGAAPFRQFTIGMEYAAGLTYRVIRVVAPWLPFHRWLVWFVCGFSSLSIVAAFIAGRALWGSATAAAVAAFAYGLSPLSFNRLIGNYGREDFALPILFLFFALFMAALRAGPGRRRAALAASLLLAAGLAVWHVSRFFATFFFLLLAPVAIFLVADRDALRRTLRALVIVLLAAGLLLPALQEKAFLLSPGFLLALALLVTIEVAHRIGLTAHRAAILFVVAAALLLVVGRLLPSAEREYSHVTGLAVEKLRHFGQKPADPARLSYDARTMWVEAFESPSPASLLLTLSTLLAWGTAALAVSARGLVARRLDAPRALATLFALFFLALFLLLERFSPFFIFFLAILLPAVLPSRAAARRAVLALLALCALYEASYDLRFDRPNRWRNAVLSAFPQKNPELVPNFGNNVRLVRWIRRHLPERAVVLTWYPTGPMVIAYTGRPINLHSKFESAALRAKERRVMEALYGDEDGFYRVCRELKSDYFVYQANLLLDNSSSSSRYMVDRLRLPTTSAAFRFHYRPEGLRHFTPIYQDSFYRVYKVHAEDEVVIPPNPVPYEEIFDAAALGDVGPIFDDAVRERSLGLLYARLLKTQEGVDLLKRRSRAEAEQAFRGILESSPDSPDPLAQLALLLSDDSRIDEARMLISRALTTHPEYPELHTVRGVLLEREGRRDEAAAAYKEALSIAPGYPTARRHLARLDRRR